MAHVLLPIDEDDAKRGLVSITLPPTPDATQRDSWFVGYSWITRFHLCLCLCVRRLDVGRFGHVVDINCEDGCILTSTMCPLRSSLNQLASCSSGFLLNETPPLIALYDTAPMTDLSVHASVPNDDDEPLFATRRTHFQWNGCPRTRRTTALSVRVARK